MVKFRAAVRHHRPILVTILPAERRARHPYQLCVMGWMVTLALSQIMFGPVPGSAVQSLTQSQILTLNIYCLVGGVTGVLAAVIPERVVNPSIRWLGRRIGAEFDATWIRLIDEAACHSLLTFVWASYLVAITALVGFVDGLSFGGGGAFWLMIAALWRFGQIVWTTKRAIVDPEPQDSAITGAENLDSG